MAEGADREELLRQLAERDAEIVRLRELLVAKDVEIGEERGRRLELESWRRRPRLEQAREHFWSYFGEIF